MPEFNQDAAREADKGKQDVSKASSAAGRKAYDQYGKPLVNNAKNNLLKQDKKIADALAKKTGAGGKKAVSGLSKLIGGGGSKVGAAAAGTHAATITTWFTTAMSAGAATIFTPVIIVVLIVTIIPFALFALIFGFDTVPDDLTKSPQEKKIEAAYKAAIEDGSHTAANKDITGTGEQTSMKKHIVEVLNSDPYNCDASEDESVFIEDKNGDGYLVTTKKCQIEINYTPSLDEASKAMVAYGRAIDGTIDFYIPDASTLDHNVQKNEDGTAITEDDIINSDGTQTLYDSDDSPDGTSDDKNSDGSEQSDFSDYLEEDGTKKTTITLNGQKMTLEATKYKSTDSMSDDMTTSFGSVSALEDDHGFSDSIDASKDTMFEAEYDKDKWSYSVEKGKIFYLDKACYLKVGYTQKLIDTRWGKKDQTAADPTATADASCTDEMKQAGTCQVSTNSSSTTANSEPENIVKTMTDDERNSIVAVKGTDEMIDAQYGKDVTPTKESEETNIYDYSDDNPDDDTASPTASPTATAPAELQQNVEANRTLVNEDIGWFDYIHSEDYDGHTFGSACDYDTGEKEFVEANTIFQGDGYTGTITIPMKISMPETEVAEKSNTDTISEEDAEKYRQTEKNYVSDEEQAKIDADKKAADAKEKGDSNGCTTDEIQNNTCQQNNKSSTDTTSNGTTSTDTVDTAQSGRDNKNNTTEAAPTVMVGYRSDELETIKENLVAKGGRCVVDNDYYKGSDQCTREDAEYAVASSIYSYYLSTLQTFGTKDAIELLKGNTLYSSGISGIASYNKGGIDYNMYASQTYYPADSAVATMVWAHSDVLISERLVHGAAGYGAKQCTNFAQMWFYDHYGSNSSGDGASGNGKDFTDRIIVAHPDQFAYGSSPAAGGIVSIDYNSSSPSKINGHVLCVDAVDYAKSTITISEGNYLNGGVRIEVTLPLDEFYKQYGAGSTYKYANPITK